MIPNPSGRSTISEEARSRAMIAAASRTERALVARQRRSRDSVPTRTRRRSGPRARAGRSSSAAAGRRTENASPAGDPNVGPRRLQVDEVAQRVLVGRTVADGPSPDSSERSPNISPSPSRSTTSVVVEELDLAAPDHEQVAGRFAALDEDRGSRRVELDPDAARGPVELHRLQRVEGRDATEERADVHLHAQHCRRRHPKRPLGGEAETPALRLARDPETGSDLEPRR